MLPALIRGSSSNSEDDTNVTKALSVYYTHDDKTMTSFRAAFLVSFGAPTRAIYLNDPDSILSE